MLFTFSSLFLPYNKIPFLSFPSPPNPFKECEKSLVAENLHSPLSLLEATE